MNVLRNMIVKAFEHFELSISSSNKKITDLFQIASSVYILYSNYIRKRVDVNFSLKVLSRQKRK